MLATNMFAGNMGLFNRGYSYTLNFNICACLNHASPPISVPSQLVGKLQQDRWTQFRNRLIAIDEEARKWLCLIFFLLSVVPLIVLLIVFIQNNMIYLIGVAVMAPSLIAPLAMICIVSSRSAEANAKLQRLCADFTQDPSDTLCYEVYRPMYANNQAGLTITIKDPNDANAPNLAQNMAATLNARMTGARGANLFAAMQQMPQQQAGPNAFAMSMATGGGAAAAAAAAGPIQIQCYACQKTFPLAPGATMAICCFCGKQNALPANLGGGQGASAPAAAGKANPTMAAPDAPPGYYSQMQ